jgi:two-component sensor histidine kinase
MDGTQHIQAGSNRTASRSVEPGARTAGVGGAALDRWTRLVPERPCPALLAFAIGLRAICAAALARWLLLPYIGDASFIIAAPAILLATLAGGRLAGLATLAVAAPLDFLFSTDFGHAAVDHAAPRFLVWVGASVFIMVVSLALRSMLLRLRARERELTAAGEQMQVLIDELEHRGRNALAIVQALSNQAARSAQSVADYRTEMAARLKALSQSYSALTRPASEVVEVSELVRSTLAPFGDQVRILGGPEREAPEKARVALVLLLHELATNATKYGALSTPSGRLTVRWTAGADGVLDLDWVERGGPQPKAVSPQGFGSRLLQAVVAAMPGGRLNATAAPDGMSIHIRFQAAPLREPAAA